MSQIKCPNCHQVINANENFCPHCGHAIAHESAGTDNPCPKCGHLNPLGAAFCEKCGAALKAERPDTGQAQSGPKVLRSAGKYSGTMVKGKTSKGWKTFKYLIIVILLIAVVAFVVWFKTDPNAGETMGNILFGAVIMLVFAFFIWRKNRKAGRKRRNSPDWDDDDDSLINSDDDGGDTFDDSDD